MLLPPQAGIELMGCLPFLGRHGPEATFRPSDVSSFSGTMRRMRPFAESSTESCKPMAGWCRLIYLPSAPWTLVKSAVVDPSALPSHCRMQQVCPHERLRFSMPSLQALWQRDLLRDLGSFPFCHFGTIQVPPKPILVGKSDWLCDAEVFLSPLALYLQRSCKKGPKTDLR